MCGSNPVPMSTLNMEPGCFFIYISNILMKRLTWLTKVKKRITSDFTTNIRSGSALLFEWKIIRPIISNEHKVCVNTNRITICQYKVGFFWNRSFPLDAVLSWGHRPLVMGPILAHVWGSFVQGQESCPKVWDLGSCPIVRGLRSFPRVHGLGFYHRVRSLGSCWMVRGPKSGPRV